MTAQKTSTPATGKGTKTDDRKPWKKKSPVEVIIAQRDRLDEQVKEKEAELKDLKDQLAKFEEVLKVFQK